MCTFDYNFTAAYLEKKFLLLWKLQSLYHTVISYFSEINFNTIFQYMGGSPNLFLPCN